MIPTLPLRPRNRLAALILAALDDERARQELHRLAAGTEPPAWLEPGERDQAARLTARARAAVAAIAAHPAGPAGPGLERTLAWARVLFDAGLHFEVHELLEPHWAAADGLLKEVLQGLIQIAVGLQHAANGNLAGARSLLAEGATRLRRGRLDGLEIAGFVAGIEELARHPHRTADAVPPFPAYRARCQY